MSQSLDALDSIICTSARPHVPFNDSFIELLNVVEAAKIKLELVIRDLQTEVRALKNKVGSVGL